MVSILSVAVLSLASVETPFQLEVPFEKYVLESNGLRVILSEDHSLPVVAVSVWYHAGPVNEPPHRTGFAHLFEHLMFQGSRHVGDDQHFAILQGAGASMVNGTTSNDRTNYFETVPANELELALWLESDRMGFLLDTLTLEKLDRQREVVKNERRQSFDNRPYGPSREKLVQALFPAPHPYFGNVIGSMDDLDAATLDDVRDFYLRFYAPANATLAIVGDFESVETRKMVDRYFGSLSRREAPERPRVATPPIGSEERREVEEPVTLPRLQIAWRSPAVFAPGDADCDVLAFILGAGKSSRLHRRLVYELEIAESVVAHQRSQELASVFAVTVNGRPGIDLGRLEKETEKILAEIRSAPPQPREVDRARNQLMTMMVSAVQQVGGFGGRAELLNRYDHFVGDPGYLARDLGRYAAVTPETVQALARSLLDPQKRVVVLTVPKK